MTTATETKKFDSVFWNPKEGESLEGKVVEMGEMKTKFGQKQFITVENSEGEKFIVFLNSVLSKIVEEEEIDINTDLSIKFLGMAKPTKGEHAYKNFEVTLS